jgi:biopolymer transport protein ExbB/TolQ
MISNKRKVATILTVVMMFMPISAYAASDFQAESAERPEAARMQEKKMNKPGERLEKIGERTESMKERRDDFMENRFERELVFLSTVEAYAPDLVEDFEGGFDELDELSETIFEIRMTYREAHEEVIREEMQSLIYTLKDEINNGTITYQEARQAMKSALAEMKEMAQLEKEAIDAALEDIREQEKALFEERKSIADILRAAVQEDDSDVAYEAIVELYGVMMERISIQEAKLLIISDIME